MSDEIVRNGWGSLRHFLPFWQPPGYVAWLALLKQAGLAFREIVWLQVGVGVLNAVLAHELFAAALELEPDYPDPHFYLGVIALAHQQLNTAQGHFQHYLAARQQVGYEDNVDTELLARSLLYFILLETRAGPTEAAKRAWHRARALVNLPEHLRERIIALESGFPDGQL